MSFFFCVVIKRFARRNFGAKLHWRDTNDRNIRPSLETMRYAVLNFRHGGKVTGTGRRNERSDRLARLTVTDEEYKLRKWCILKNDVSNKWRHPLCPQATFVPDGIVISRE